VLLTSYFDIVTSNAIMRPYTVQCAMTNSLADRPMYVD